MNEELKTQRGQVTWLRSHDCYLSSLDQNSGLWQPGLRYPSAQLHMVTQLLCTLVLDFPLVRLTDIPPPATPKKTVKSALLTENTSGPPQRVTFCINVLSLGQTSMLPWFLLSCGSLPPYLKSRRTSSFYVSPGGKQSRQLHRYKSWNQNAQQHSVLLRTNQESESYSRWRSLAQNGGCSEYRCLTI